MNKVLNYLNRQIKGNVFDNPNILEAYSTDRSVLKILPKYVALPESTDDVRKLARFINQLAIKDYRIPIAIRGSGLDATGADLTNGLIISTEKLNKIKEIDTYDRLVHVEAGITIGELNSALISHGLILPVNVDPRETVGSLVANATTDSYAYRYGGIMNYVDRAEIVLASGDVIQTSRFGQRGFSRRKSMTNVEGIIYRDLNRILQENESTIKTLKNNRNFAGYPNIQYVLRDDGNIYDPLTVFFGSQGTLGIITEVILRTVLVPPKIEHILVSFNSFRLANDFLSFAKSLHPLELNFYNQEIINIAEANGKCPEFLKNHSPEGYLVYASFCDKPRVNRKKLEKCIEFLPKSAKSYLDNDKKSDFGAILNSLTSYLNDNVEGERAPFVNDFYVPSDEIANFISDLKFLEQKYKILLPIYGSYATSIYSVRPDVKLSTEPGRRFIAQFITDFNKLLRIHYGYICGGNPEGRLKALLTNHELTVAEKNLYREIKETFDPNKILAPDAKLGSDARSVSPYFRTTENSSIML